MTSSSHSMPAPGFSESDPHVVDAHDAAAALDAQIDDRRDDRFSVLVVHQGDAAPRPVLRP